MIHPPPILLVQAAPSPLQTFLRLYPARWQSLERIGVEVLLNRMVQNVDMKVLLSPGTNALTSKAVLWAAGVVTHFQLHRWLKARSDGAGRVRSRATAAGSQQAMRLGHRRCSCVGHLAWQASAQPGAGNKRATSMWRC